MGEPTEKPPKEIESEDEEDQTFETLGLDGRIIRALNKKKIHKPTPIQLAAIPLTFKVRHLLISFRCFRSCWLRNQRRNLLRVQSFSSLPGNSLSRFIQRFYH